MGLLTSFVAVVRHGWLVIIQRGAISYLIVGFFSTSLQIWRAELMIRYGLWRTGNGFFLSHDSEG